MPNRQDDFLMHNKPENSSINLLFIFLSGLMLLVFVALLFPYYKYYIDPDAVHYLTLVKRYLNNIEAHKYNGLWSPLGIWFTAIFVKLTGWSDLFKAALWVNAIGGMALVMTCQLICQRWILKRIDQIIFAVINAAFWAFAVYKQSFTDIWFYFFITVFFLLAADARLLQQSKKWILLGLLGAISFYAKSYALYFVPLFLISVVVIQAYFYQQKIAWKRMLSMLIVVGVIMLSLILPWVYCLYQQYGIITFSTAGKMNLSWFMYGTFIPKDMYAVIQPPLDAHSINYFEDPWYVQDYFPQWYENPTFFLKQVIRMLYNIIDFIAAANHLSSFYLIALFVYVFAVIKRAEKIVLNGLLPMIILFILFPIGFWPKGFELGRHMWITVPIGFLLILLLYRNVLQKYVPKKLQNLLVCLIGISFLIGPVLDLKRMYENGYDEHDNALILAQAGVHNRKFICNQTPDSKFYQAIIRLAYMSENQYYQHVNRDLRNNVLIPEAKKMGVTHYFYFFDDTSDDYRPLNENGEQLQELKIAGLKGLKVFLIK